MLQRRFVRGTATCVALMMLVSIYLMAQVAQLNRSWGRGIDSVSTRIEELGPAIREAFEAGQPACINVEIDVRPTPPELHLLMRR